MGERIFNTNEIIITLGGIQISEYETEIVGTYASPRYTKRVGADGEVVRIADRDKTWTFKFDLKKTSSSNSKLSALVAIDNASHGGVVPFLMKTIKGETIMESDSCWVVSRGLSRQWKIDTGQMAVYLETLVY